MKDIVIILFNDFETLDVFGPAEVFGRLTEHFNLMFYSDKGGIVTSAQKVQVVTEPIKKISSKNYILLIPGGIGTRELMNDSSYIMMLGNLAKNAEYILTVCTGSALFSKTGLLDNKNATSNKRVFSWVEKVAPEIKWIKKARWVKDGNIYTSSGVSAGIDMSLGFISDTIDYKTAKKVSIEIEYEWREDPQWDPFSELY